LFLLPLLPEFSIKFCLKIASSEQCFDRVASKLPQLLPQEQCQNPSTSGQASGAAKLDYAIGALRNAR